jgi:hypothetical protein
MNSSKLVRRPFSAQRMNRVLDRSNEHYLTIIKKQQQLELDWERIKREVEKGWFITSVPKRRTRNDG